MPEWLLKILQKCRVDENGKVDFTGVSEEVAAAISKNFVDMETYRGLSGKLTAANNTIADLQKVDVEGLQKELADEKLGRAKDRREYETRALLTGAGCKDVDYLLYKLGDTVEYDENNKIKDPDALLSTVKEAYQAQFAQPAAPNVVRPTGGAKPELTKAKFQKLGYRERLLLKRGDPETYQKMMEENANE